MIELSQWPDLIDTYLLLSGSNPSYGFTPTVTPTPTPSPSTTWPYSRTRWRSERTKLPNSWKGVRAKDNSSSNKTLPQECNRLPRQWKTISAAYHGKRSCPKEWSIYTTRCDKSLNPFSLLFVLRKANQILHEWNQSGWEKLNQKLKLWAFLPFN